MIRFVLRFFGLLLLALGFIFLVYDGIRSISDGNFLLTRTSEVWNIIHDRSLVSFQTLVETRAGADISNRQARPEIQHLNQLCGIVSIPLLLGILENETNDQSGEKPGITGGERHDCLTPP